MSKTRREKHAATRHRATTAVLLGALADALNACEKAGLRMRLDWAAWCHQGVVMPPHKKQGWTARPFGVLPTSPARDGGEDE